MFLGKVSPKRRERRAPIRETPRRQVCALFVVLAPPNNQAPENAHAGQLSKSQSDVRE
jgi:hypothetical protein